MSATARVDGPAGAGEILVDLQGLGIQYGDRVLVEGVDLLLRAGQVTAVMGPSGSGKSLTARAVMGHIPDALRVTAGSLRYPPLSDRDWLEGPRGLDGRAARRAARRLRKETASLRGAYMTYSPQAAASALNPGRTLGRQLQLAVERRDEAPSDLGAEIRHLLTDVGLPPSASAARPSELSGGMCQRAALAVAVAPNPRLLIADEPETGLDPVLTRAVIELMLSICQRRGFGLLLISHHQATVDRIADAVVHLPGRGGHRG